MLTEHFIASVGEPTKGKLANTANKDAGICLYEFQPLAGQRTVYKKSITGPNCLALSEDHVFAAQIDRAVVHIYDRTKGNQEATVPFTERITSLTLACDDTILILGTLEGRLFLWETFSGRQITTPQAHLQAVTVLNVDATSNFLLSGSQDSSVHVWSIPDLLSFSRTADASPLRTFSLHRSGITALELGHAAFNCNFAVSASSDKTCHLWDYRTNTVLRTYLLPGLPTSLALDPVDRAVYVGYEDGAVQELDLFLAPATSLDAVQNGTNAADAVQPSTSSLWRLQDTQQGAALDVSVSFDGCTLISGHTSGSILAWDIAKGTFASNVTHIPLSGPVTNVSFLPVKGFRTADGRQNIKVNEITKPRFGAFSGSESGIVPNDYTIHVQLPASREIFGSDIHRSQFDLALCAPSFSTETLEDGLHELATFGKSHVPRLNDNLDEDQDYLALDGSSKQNGKLSLEEENLELRSQLEALRRVQKKTFEKMTVMGDERRALMKQEQRRLSLQASRKPNGQSTIDDELTVESETMAV